MGTRAQCIVIRNNKILMTRHRLDGEEWWCLPGGGVEAGETAAAAALRELNEECSVKGTIIKETSSLTYAPDDQSVTFLIDIGSQKPVLGMDPEYEQQVLVDLKWLNLSEIPERDRAFLWAAGLLGIEEFFTEMKGWGADISYPRRK